MFNPVLEDEATVVAKAVEEVAKEKEDTLAVVATIEEETIKQVQAEEEVLMDTLEEVSMMEVLCATFARRRDIHSMIVISISWPNSRLLPAKSMVVVNNRLSLLSIVLLQP